MLKNISNDIPTNISTNPHKINEDLRTRTNKLFNKIKDENFLDAEEEIYQFILYLQELKILMKLKHENYKKLRNNEDIEYIKMVEEKIFRTKLR